ncbi:STAS domain-containing protein [Rhodococcus sovatensis]|uniref:STAS domain-containing protein n=1 Tax=Rhodococcus sovatensis TaxID=1805840 RepID=A0ABZ2PNV8_9NOCA
MSLRSIRDSFSMAVDESPGGPIVITVQGAVCARGNARLFTECLTGTVAAYRPIVIDLVAATAVDGDVMSAIADAASRLAHRQYRTVIVCRPSMTALHSLVQAEHVDVEYVDTPGSVFEEAKASQGEPIAATDALWGTYL